MIGGAVRRGGAPAGPLGLKTLPVQSPPPHWRTPLIPLLLKNNGAGTMDVDKTKEELCKCIYFKTIKGK